MEVAMFGQLVMRLRNRIFVNTAVAVFMEAERQEALAAEQDVKREPQGEAEGEPEWMRTITLDDPLMPVEDLHWLKRRRAILNYGNSYGNGDATESDMGCLTQEERERLEVIDVQVRWDRFLERPKGVDALPGCYFK